MVGVLTKGLMKTKPKQEFYRGKYFIAMCESFGLEYVYRTFDNVYEFSEIMNRDINSAKSTLHRIFKGERKGIIYRNRRYDIVFIEIESQGLEENKHGKEIE